jgi:hypothetical protein
MRMWDRRKFAPEPAKLSPGATKTLARVNAIKAKIGSLSPAKRGEISLLGDCCNSLISEDIPWLIDQIESIFLTPCNNKK